MRARVSVDLGLRRRRKNLAAWAVLGVGGRALDAVEAGARVPGAGYEKPQRWVAPAILIATATYRSMRASWMATAVAVRSPHRTYRASDFGRARGDGENTACVGGLRRRCAAVRAQTGFHARRVADDGIRTSMARMAAEGAVPTGDEWRGQRAMAQSPMTFPEARTITTRSACSRSMLRGRPGGRVHDERHGMEAAGPGRG